MGYRPICDMWLLARPKVKFYGTYPNGFLERARTILGCSYEDPILHVCGGKAKEYPNKGFGPNDKTLDINPDLQPDFVVDVTKDEIPTGFAYYSSDEKVYETYEKKIQLPSPVDNWKAILIDPPYTMEDAFEYGEYPFPMPNELLKKCIDAIPIGRCVGMLHCVIPAVPKNCKEIALIGVVMGNNNRIRCFSVFRKVKE